MRPLGPFAEGAIPAVRAPLSDKIVELVRHYPVAAIHRRLVRNLGGEFVFATQLRTTGKRRDEGKWLCLVRFGKVIERRFGFIAEIPLIYDHHHDLQIRTVDRIPDFLRQLPSDRRTVKGDVSFISTQDPRTEDKAFMWSSPTRVLIPMPSSELAEPNSLLAAMSRLLFTRDLYAVRGAVTGRDFFGRHRLIGAVMNDVNQGRVPGIFGLRKTGKTSLLQEIVRSCRHADQRTGRKRAFVYQDLEHLSGFHGDPVAELLNDLREAIRQELQKSGLRTFEVAELGEDVSLPEFRRALDQLLSRLGEGEELVLMLDEIEHLCHPNAETEEGTPSTEKVPQLFGVLRKLVQERPNFGLVISGLASASIEASELYGRENPLFSLAVPYFLGPFNAEEGGGLLRQVGEQVGLRWDDDAVALALSETGGSAMLLRELGSEILSTYPADRLQVETVTQSRVVASLDPWRRRVSSNLREIVINLQRFYSDESFLLEYLFESAEEFASAAYDFPDQINRLEQIGVIEPVGDQWVPTRVLQMGWELVRATVPVAGPPDGGTAEDPHMGSGVFSKDAVALVSEEESSYLEFKQTATYNPHTGTKDSDLLNSVLKTVAGFLNASSGTLLIGVHDQGRVLGLADDLRVASPRQDLDGFENWLTGRLINELGKPVVASDLTVSFPLVDTVQICRIDVQAADQPVFLGTDERFFVRVQNTTQELNPGETTEYVRSHWPSV